MDNNLQVIRVKENNKIVLQPYNLHNITSAVQKAVMNLLFTYREHENVGSIIIAINKIQIMSDLIETFDDQAQLFLDIEYQLTLMLLKPGTLVRGKLVQQQQSHIIVQLFGLINVVIQDEEISDKIYVWNDEFNSFINLKSKEVLTQDQELQIQIIEFIGNQTDIKMFEIKGSLKDRKTTGLIHMLAQPLEEQDKINKIIEKSSKYIN